MKRWIFEILFFSFAIAYLSTLHLNPYPYNYLVKTIPIWSLMAMAFLIVKGRDGMILGVGLLLSSGGDVALVFNRQGDKSTAIYFMTGLGFFLCAHICYIILFSREMKFRRQLLPLMTALCMYSLVMALILINSPKAEPMLIPILAYLVVITAMGVYSILRYPAPWYLIVGALTFIASDSMIAIHSFLRGFIGASFFIMLSYYIAQYLILQSFLSMKKSKVKS